MLAMKVGKDEHSHYSFSACTILRAMKGLFLPLKPLLTLELWCNQLTQPPQVEHCLCPVLIPTHKRIKIGGHVIWGNGINWQECNGSGVNEMALTVYGRCRDVGERPAPCRDVGAGAATKRHLGCRRLAAILYVLVLRSVRSFESCSVLSSTRESTFVRFLCAVWGFIWAFALPSASLNKQLSFYDRQPWLNRGTPALPRSVAMELHQTSRSSKYRARALPASPVRAMRKSRRSLALAWA